MMNRCLKQLALGALAIWIGQPTHLPGEVLARHEVETGLKRAVTFFVNEVSVEGSYLWQYSADLARREGEGKATATQGWIQPPGTPSVGEAYLLAFQATGDRLYLEAAQETAQALVNGQLTTGGWNYYVDFDPQGKRPLAYRTRQVAGKLKRTTTLDDDTTQSALRFLMRVDQVLEFGNPEIHDSVGFALDQLIKAQYPNGAWPQRYDHLPAPEMGPIRSAAYPESWSWEYPGGRYDRAYTFNDNVIADMIRTLFEAAEIYGVPQAGARFNERAAACRVAAVMTGDFIRLAQLPEPQPAWAQQYAADMTPRWARKFEPPAVTGGESQGVLRILLELYQKTGQKRFLEPIPRALEYLKQSRLTDGRLARFYELRTNKPLYFTRDYQLTYDDSDLPTHYSFKVTDGTRAISRVYEKLIKLDADDLQAESQKPVHYSKPDPRGVRRILEALDSHGRWIEAGRLRYHGDNDPTSRVIRCDTFIRNTRLLCHYLLSSDKNPE